MVKLSVQWSKEKYEVEYDSSLGLEGFQAVLFSLTNVPLERQKLMAKGKMVKDATVLDALKDGDKVMLMGTADALPQAPTKAIVFEEDLTDAQKIGVVKDALSAGLHNLGNTCYLASTLQCLRATPELKSALITRSNGAQPAQHDPHHAVVRQLGRLYSEMDRTADPVTPMMFTTVFRSTFPQFSETDQQGHWMQQDAEEAMMQLINSMAQVLKPTGAPASAAAVASSSSASSTDAAAGNTIDEFFGGKLEVHTMPLGMKEGEAGAVAKVTTETYRRLQCFITSEVNFLFQGLRLGLREELELRGQMFERTRTLLTLPRYLIVQMMRFDFRVDTQKKSKKLRKVDFPLKLDMAEFAHPTLKHQLLAARNILKEEQDAKLGLPSAAKKAKTEEAKATTDDAANPWATGAGNTDGAAAMEVDSTGAAAAAPMTLTTPTSGQFELYGLVTHKGRTSDSGHYVAWSKQSDGQWMKFDDEKVSRVPEDAIKSLAGGGDNDIAYLLFYRRIDDMTSKIGTSIPPPSGANAESKDTKTDASTTGSSSVPPAAAK